jgi:hypothetical protein
MPVRELARLSVRLKPPMLFGVSGSGVILFAIWLSLVQACRADILGHQVGRDGVGSGDRKEKMTKSVICAATFVGLFCTSAIAQQDRETP